MGPGMVVHLLLLKGSMDVTVVYLHLLFLTQKRRVFIIV